MGTILFPKGTNVPKGTFCPKMGTIKDINSKDVVDAEEIKKRWKEYMEELYRKDPDELDYSDSVVNHREPDFLESKVKWALGSTAINKASGCDWRRQRHLTPVLLPGKSHGWRSLVGCGPWGR